MDRLISRNKRLPLANPMGLFPVRFSHSQAVYLTVYLLKDQCFVYVSGRHLPVMPDHDQAYKAVEIHVLNLPERLYRALIRADICLIEEVTGLLHGANIPPRGIGQQSKDHLSQATASWTPLLLVAPA